jgi:hypothetical protein
MVEFWKIPRFYARNSWNYHIDDLFAMLGLAHTGRVCFDDTGNLSV